MDLDYHFGTVYVLSRWADFGSFNARTIAASSQLVDDNFDTTPFSDTEEKKNIILYHEKPKKKVKKFDFWKKYAMLIALAREKDQPA